MSTSIPHFLHCEEAFLLSPIPVWLLDPETFRVLWANAVAIEFWNASSLEELAARDMLTNVPEAILVRLNRTISRIKEGEAFREDWTFFPKGKPTSAILHLRPLVWRDGRIVMLNQATKIEEDASAFTIRGLAMLRHAKATLVYVDVQGKIFAQNSLSTAEFGDSTSWLSWLTNEETALEIIRGAHSGNSIEVETSVKTIAGIRIHSILAHHLRDPVTGNFGVLIQHFDVTERVEAERLVQKHVARLQEQQREILELSTPFLDVGARTLALPLIGKIDETRLAKITSRLLEMVANRNIERVILDITGVVSVDDTSLVFLRRLVDAIMLLGAKPIVTGIRSDLARMLAASDENLAGITIRRSLAEGLAERRFDRNSPRQTVFLR